MSERILLESGNGEFTLSTHKIRHETQRGGAYNFKSIPLEELTGSEVKRKSHPMLLSAAGVAILAGGAFAFTSNDPEAMFGGLGLAAILAFVYWASQRQVIVFSSLSTKIELSANSMGVEKAVAAVNRVEQAKQQRGRLQSH